MPQPSHNPPYTVCMTLKEILEQHPFDIIFSELTEMMHEISRKRPAIKEAYDFLISLAPVAWKKRIVYQLLEDEETDDCFVGAADTCFQAQWNVIIGKEVVRDDVEISDLEIATNAFLCILLLGYPPRRFAGLHDELLEMLS